MTTHFDHDLTLSLLPEAARREARRVPLVAFVPITVALIGVALVLFGGLKARDPATEVGALQTIDPIVTSAIAVRDARHDLETLDR